MSEKKWIKVEDGTPDVLTNNLVCRQVDGLREIAWAFYNSRRQWTGSNEFYNDVTHWMELPDLPEDSHA